MRYVFGFLVLWACFWGCVEAGGFALIILGVLSPHRNVVEFAFAMAILAFPVGGIAGIVAFALGGWRP